MRATKFPQATRSLRPPPGMNEDQCLPLYVFQDGQHVISRWEPDEEDRARIATGEPVWLWITGITMPPAALTTTNPFGEQPPIPVEKMPADVRIADLEHQVLVATLAQQLAQAELNRIDPTKWSAPEENTIAPESARAIFAWLRARAAE